MLYRLGVLLTLATVATDASIHGIAINAEGEAIEIDSVNLLQTVTPRAATSHEELQEVIANTEFTGHDPQWPSGPLPVGDIYRSLMNHFEIEHHAYDPGAVIAEYVAMTLFVVIGCGSAMAVAGEPGWVLQVAMSFGLGITALVYAIGHFSGGHINPAVTLGLVIAGKCSVLQGSLNFLAQLCGSITGAALLMGMFPEEKDKTGGLGANAVQAGWGKFNAFIAEFIGTFLLMFVVFQTAINPASKANREMAALAIGLAVFLAHCVLIPIDGCSINPARSFGPAVVRKLCYSKNSGSFEDMWVFWAGPLLGAAGAALLSTKVLS